MRSSPKRRACGGVFGLVLAALAGCTPAVIPPAVSEADAALDRRDTQLVAAARPALVAEATALAQRAREAAERGESERATLLARQALQRLQTAKNFAEREQGERVAAALARGANPRGPVDGRAMTAEPKPPPPEAPAPAPRREGESLRALAEQRLVQVALRRSELLGQQRDQSCAAPFRELEAVLELAHRRFAVGDYERAYEFAVRAEERARSCDVGPPPAPPGAPRREADDEAGRRRAAAAMQRAQAETARVQALGGDEPQGGPLVQALALLRAADTWYARRSFLEAAELATRAHALLVRVPSTVASSAPSREQAESALAEARAERERCPPAARTRGSSELEAAERAWLARAYAGAIASATRATESFRAGTAVQTCAEATVSLEAARRFEATLGAGEADGAREGASALLNAAAVKLAAGACAEATALASRARAALDEGARVARRPPTPAHPTPGPAVLRAETFVAERLARVGPLDGVDPAWKPAYRAIFLALALREDAGRTSPHSRALGGADALLRGAREAWDKQRFSEAGRIAGEAAEVLSPLAAPSADEGSPAELAQARARAAQALRSANDLATACTSARCGQRAARDAEASATFLEAAKVALGSGRFQAATELAGLARSHLDAALRAPLAATKASRATERAAVAELERALDAATAASALCDAARCEPGLASKGRVALGLAIAARADGRTGDGHEAALEARRRLRAAALAGLEIPVQAAGITREDTQLRVSPALGFKPLSTELRAASEPGIAALARTLVDNQAALGRVRVVVTAEPGAQPQAAGLALRRAERLRAVLLGRGVSPNLVVAEAAPPASAAIPPRAAASVAVHLEIAEAP